MAQLHKQESQIPALAEFVASGLEDSPAVFPNQLSALFFWLAVIPGSLVTFGISFLSFKNKLQKNNLADSLER